MKITEDNEIIGSYQRAKEAAEKEIFGVRRDPHPQQDEGVRLGSGVVTPWIKPNWPSNFQ